MICAFGRCLFFASLILRCSSYRVLRKSYGTVNFNGNNIRKTLSRLNQNLDDSIPESFTTVDVNALNQIATTTDSGFDTSETCAIKNTFILNFVAILWGSQHLIIKNAVSLYPAPSLVNFSRFLVASVFFSPAAVTALQKGNVATIKAGSELGLYSFLGFAFQAIGLEYTTASRSAFLLYLNVKFVPFLAAFLLKRRIAVSTWVSASLALGGTYLLSTDGGPINVGDLWSMAAALASAMFILRLENFANQNSSVVNNVATTVSQDTGDDDTQDCPPVEPLVSASSSSSIDPVELSGLSSVVATLLCGIWLLKDLLSTSLSTTTGVGVSSVLGLASEWFTAVLHNPLPPLYLGIVITGFCGYLQTLGQRGIPAERAAIIFSLDPVYAAVFSWLLAGDQLGARSLIGCGFVLCGVWVSSRSNKVIDDRTSFSSNSSKSI